VIRGIDGHDADAIKAAIEAAMQSQDKPTLLCCRTTIGFGSPAKAGKESSHGAPLGKEEVAATRASLNWPYAPFEIPEDIRLSWRARDAGLVREHQWGDVFDAYADRYPELSDELIRRSRNELPDGFATDADAYIAELQAQGPTIASRKASQLAIEAFAQLLPELIGGSADLAHSNLTLWKGSKSVTSDDADANYIYFGVREFAMTAISNGLALHGCFIPYDATFLVFSDYARNAVRMSALMGAHAIHVYTHDSIGLGEDGPTHQPIEHLAALRYIPHNDVWRPCDAVESAVSWRAAIERRDGPSCLVFSRQNLAHQPRTDAQLADIGRGGYVLRESVGAPELILIATGSEVGIAMEAAARLGNGVRVVSMPSSDVFDRQEATYREAVLPNACRKRVAIEAGVSDFWRKYVGLDGAVVGIDSFGASAPIEALMPHFGFTVDNVVAMAQALR